MPKRIALIILGAIVIIVAAYAGWYTYMRHEKIVQNAHCDQLLSQPSKPGVPNQLCMPAVVPPPLTNLIRGKLTFDGTPPRFDITIPKSLIGILLAQYSLAPKTPLPCDQSATTTDCAALIARIAQNQPPPEVPATTTASIGNFTFEYPGKATLGEFGWEGVVIPGDYQLHFYDNNNDYAVYIFTEPGSLSPLNPHATSLDDYRSDYPLSATGTEQKLVNGKPTTITTQQEVRIISSDDVTINGIPMLKQHYSVGEWSLDAKGNRVFDTSLEYDVDNELRYVFYDGRSFVAITGWHSDPYIEEIVHSVHLK